MIRIYLDWNVISNLKRPEFKELKDFFKKNKFRLIIPYTSAHFTDLMKSYSSDNMFFQSDVDTLEWLSNNIHFSYSKEKLVFPSYYPVKDFMQNMQMDKCSIPIFNMENVISELNEASEDLGLESLGDLLKTMLQNTSSELQIDPTNEKALRSLLPNISRTSSQWDFLQATSEMMNQLLTNKTYYKDLRKSIVDGGLKLEQNSGNWKDDEVIDNINLYLKSKGLDKTFLEYVKFTLDAREEQTDHMMFFTACYNFFDLIGYKPDKLRKPTDTAQNIYTDADHAYFAGYCDYFVVGDSILAKKARILYNEFEVHTQVVEPENLVEIMANKFFPKEPFIDFFDEAYNKFEGGTEEIDIKNASSDYKFAISRRLEGYYFDFFNYAALLIPNSSDRLEIYFYRRPRNFSNFFLPEEFESVVNKILKYFDSKVKKVDVASFLSDLKENDSFELIFPNLSVTIEIEKYNNLIRPRLKFILFTK